MSDMNTNVLVEAKKEYTKHISNILTPVLYRGLRNVYNNVRNTCDRKNDTNILKNFQIVLKQIPQWTDEILDKEYERIKNQPNCDWLDDLIKAVFISNVKILSSIRGPGNRGKFELNLPSSKRFIHKCYIECAREFYQNPYLFSHKVSNEIDLHRNLHDIREIITRSIEEAIRKLLPVQHILRQYLGDNYEPAVGEDDISKSVDEHMQDNLKKMVKQELQDMLDESPGDKLEELDNDDSEKLDSEKLDSEKETPKDDELQSDNVKSIEIGNVADTDTTKPSELEDSHQSPKKTSKDADADAVADSESRERGDINNDTDRSSRPITPNKYRHMGMKITPRKRSSVSRIGGGKKKKSKRRAKSPPPRKIDTSHLEEESNIFFSDADEYFSE